MGKKEATRHLPVWQELSDGLAAVEAEYVAVGGLDNNDESCRGGRDGGRRSEEERGRRKERGGRKEGKWGPSESVVDNDDDDMKDDRRPAGILATETWTLMNTRIYTLKFKPE